MIHIIYMAGGNSRRFGSNKLMYELEGKPLYRHCLDRLLYLLSEEKEMTLTVVSQYPELLCQVEKIVEAEQFLKTEQCPASEPVLEAEQPPAAEEKSLEKNRRLQTVYSENSLLGASYTIKAGLEAVRTRYGIVPAAAFLFVVADQPYLSLATLRKFPEIWRGMNSGKEAGINCGREAEMNSGPEERMNRERAERLPMVTAWGSRQGNPCLFPAELVPELMELTGDQGGKRVLRGKRIREVQAEDEKELLDIDCINDILKLHS